MKIIYSPIVHVQIHFKGDTPMITSNYSTAFLKDLNGIVLQQNLEKTLDTFHRLPVMDHRRYDIMERMVKIIQHPFFSVVCYARRCGECRGSLSLSEVDKGSAYVCDCGETEDLFMRHIFYERSKGFRW